MDTDALILELAERQHGMVGRRQLLDAGVGSNEIHHRIERGNLRRVSPEVLRVAGAPTSPLGEAMAAVLDAPGEGFLSHRSAAALWKLPGFDLRCPLQVVIPWQGTTRRNRLCVVHYHRGLPRDQLGHWEGIPVTSPALTLFLLAGSERRGRVERALDNAVVLGLVRIETMHRLLGELAARGRNGIRMMRELLEERPPGYRPPESNTERRVEELAGIVGVKLRRQVDVGDDDTWFARIDFEVCGTIGVIEVHSVRHHWSLADRRRDEERIGRTEASGRPVLVLWDHDIWQRPDQVVEEIAAFVRQLRGGI